MKLRLQYQNIGDNEADDFIGHYDQVKGGFETFTLPMNLGQASKALRND